MEDEQAVKPRVIEPTTTDQKPASRDEESISIAKPGEGGLEKFRSKRAASIPGVETLLTTLPHHSMPAAKDFVRLHPNEAKYWSPEYCFVEVPIKGQKRGTLHLIDEELAMRYLPNGRIQRFRLALATKPNDNFFLCHVTSQNLENPWNHSNLEGCLQAKTHWTQATSRKGENAEGYKIDYAKDQDAFPEPNWPKQRLVDLILLTFKDRMIDQEDHPALLRLIGAKPPLS